MMRLLFVLAFFLSFASLTSGKVWGGFEDIRLDTAGSTTPSLYGDDRFGLLELITNTGFEVQLTAELTEEFLENIDVFYPSVLSRDPEGQLSGSEITALENWINSGGIFIGVVDGGLGFADPYQSIISHFDDFTVSDSFSGFVLPHNDHPLGNGVEKVFFNLGSIFDVTNSNAEVIFSNEQDQAAVVLLENIGQQNGAMIFIGDSTFIRDQFIGEYDNEQFLVNLIQWAFDNGDSEQEQEEQSPTFIPSTDACSDDIQFLDSGNDDCTFYEANPTECLHAATYINKQGKDATDSCCVCGGGVDFTRDILNGIVELQNTLDGIGADLGLDMGNLRESIRNVQTHLENSISDHSDEVKDEVIASIADLEADLGTIASSITTGHSELLDTLRAVEASLVAILNTNSQDIASVRDSISALETSVNSLQTTLSEQFTAQSTGISALQTTINDVNVGLAQQLITINGDITSLKEEMNGIQTSLDDAVTSRNMIIGACDNLAAAVTSFRSFVEEMDSDIENTLTNHGEKLNSIEATVNSFQATLSSLQTAVTTGFTNIQTEITNTIEEVKAAVADVKSEMEHQHTDLAFLTNDLRQDTAEIIEAVGDVDADVQNVGTSVQNLDTEFAEIDTSVASLDTSFGTISETISSLQLTIDALSVDVTTINTQITDLGAAAQDNAGSIQSDLDTLDANILNQIEAVTVEVNGIKTTLSELQTSVLPVVTGIVTGIPNAVDELQDSIYDISSTVTAIGDLINEFRQSIDDKFQAQQQQFAEALATQQDAIFTRLNEIQSGCSSQNEEIASIRESVDMITTLLNTFVIERDECVPFDGIADADSSVCCLSSCAKCDDSRACFDREGGADGCCVATIKASNDICDGESDAPCVIA